MVKFVLLSPRRGDGVLAAEYDDFLRFTELKPTELEQRPLNHAEAPLGDFTDVTGIFIGGSPFTITDRSVDGVEPEWQEAITKKLAKLIANAAGIDRYGVPAEEKETSTPKAAGIPVLAVCYGAAMMAEALDGTVSQRYGESAGETIVHKTQAGESDPLTQHLPQEFSALTGHKDSVEELPTGATLLLTGPSCPTQLYRLGNNVWISQFHPEMDPFGIARRVSHYDNNGYYDPAEKAAVFDKFVGVDTAATNALLSTFVNIARRRETRNSNLVHAGQQVAHQAKLGS